MGSWSEIHLEHCSEKIFKDFQELNENSIQDGAIVMTESIEEIRTCDS